MDNSFYLIWPPSGSCKGLIKYGLSIFPSFHLSFCLSGCFLGITSLVFSNFDMVLEIHMKLYVTAGFSGNFFCPQNWEKWARNRVFEFIKKFGHYFLLNLFYNENLYLLCSWTNPIFGKVFVPEIWAKIFSANLIPKFFNHLYLQNKSMK